MTRVQKVFCVFLCLCFLVVLAVMPEPFSLWKIIENVYRQFPLYYFIEEKTQETWLETDKQTLAQIARENGKYLGQQMQSKNKTEEDNIEEKKEEELKTNPKTDTNSKALTETETTAAAQQAARPAPPASGSFPGQACRL